MARNGKAQGRRSPFKFKSKITITSNNINDTFKYNYLSFAYNL